jgi:hypothetical protein
VVVIVSRLAFVVAPGDHFAVEYLAVISAASAALEVCACQLFLTVCVDVVDVLYQGTVEEWTAWKWVWVSRELVTNDEWEVLWVRLVLVWRYEGSRSVIAVMILASAVLVVSK